MVFLRAKLFTVCAATATVLAAPTTYATPPIVTLDKGTLIGTSNGGVNTFLGIPFAQPPSVIDVISALSAWTDPPDRPFLTELVTCASVRPRRLPPTPPVHTTQLCSVFLAPNKQLRWQFQVGYLKRRSSLRSSRKPQLKTVKIVRPLLRFSAKWRAFLTITIGLNLNVIVPSHARPGSMLPVVVVCTQG